MKLQDRDYIYVRDVHGNRKKMTIKEYQKQFSADELVSEPVKYDYDLDWDLSHGYITLEKFKEKINNDNNK